MTAYPEIDEVLAGTRDWCVVTGDARIVLPTLPAASIDMVFADPPYGHNNNNGDLIHRWEAALGQGPVVQEDARAIANDGPRGVSCRGGSKTGFRVEQDAQEQETMTPLPLPGEPHMTAHFTDAHRQAANDAKQRAHNPQELLQHANLNLSQHAQERVLARLQQTPLNLRKTYLIAIAGKRPTTAIRAFCQMCIGYTRTQVANCSDPACPLFNYRPNW